MTLMAHDVQRMALRQLETALRLYSEREDYYSVTTLAGASEEIFGNLLLEKFVGELKSALLGFPDDDSPLRKKLQDASNRLTKDLEALKQITAQFSKEPEEAWNKSLGKLKREAGDALNQLVKDVEKIKKICTELPNDEYSNRLKGVFARYESPRKSFSASVIKIEKLLSESFGEEENPTESNVRQRSNWIRNTLKHWWPGQPKVVKFDAAEEAKDLLNRAIDNYRHLTEGIPTPAMEKFQDETVTDNAQIRPPQSGPCGPA